MSIINALIESVVLVLCIKLILPINKKFDYINLSIYIVSVTLTTLLLSYNNVVFVALYHTALILIIKFVDNVKTYVASISIVLMNLISTMASLLATTFGIYLYKEIFDYRFLLRDRSFTYLSPKIFFLIIITVIAKSYFGMVKKKVKTHKTRPKSLIILNVATVVITLLLTLIVIEYLSQNYSMIKQIPQLDTIFFAALGFVALALILMHYFLTLYIFNHTHYKIMKIYAETDPLTGISNRQAGMQFLNDRMIESANNKTPLTICFIDVNNLKVVNDRWGHNEGDRLISTVSEIIRNNLRGNDSICRLGGDEFLVTFANCDMPRAEKIWDRISKSFVNFNYQSGLKYDITVSYGFAEYNGEQNVSVKELIEQADKEMYEYKTNFKKGFVYK